MVSDQEVFNYLNTTNFKFYAFRVMKLAIKDIFADFIDEQANGMKRVCYEELVDQRYNSLKGVCQRYHEIWSRMSNSIWINNDPKSRPRDKLGFPIGNKAGFDAIFDKFCTILDDGGSTFREYGDFFYSILRKQKNITATYYETNIVSIPRGAKDLRLPFIQKICPECGKIIDIFSNAAIFGMGECKGCGYGVYGIDGISKLKDASAMRSGIVMQSDDNIALLTGDKNDLPK